MTFIEETESSQELQFRLFGAPTGHVLSLFSSPVKTATSIPKLSPICDGRPRKGAEHATFNTFSAIFAPLRGKYMWPEPEKAGE